MNITERLKRRMHNLQWLVWAGDRKDSKDREDSTPAGLLVALRRIPDSPVCRELVFFLRCSEVHRS